MRNPIPDAITLAPISPVWQFSKISEKFKKMEGFVTSQVSTGWMKVADPATFASVR